MKKLSDQDISSLYMEFQTPEHVRRHCRAVTDCALRLAQALMASGPEAPVLDPDLIYGAGMVHDMARTLPHHETAAADRLEELGFLREAAIVREHMRTMTYHDIDHVTEADLLYFSDRIVQEDTFVGVKKRFDYFREKMIKNGRDPDSEMARNNRRHAEEFEAAIEKKTGRTLSEICSG